MNYGLRDSKEYLDWANAVQDSLLNVIAVDQEKFNLTYLVFPGVEEQGLECLPEAYVASVNEYMDKETRKQLMLPPLTFMRYWQDLHKDPRLTLQLVQHMPTDYMARMVVSSHKVQARMVVQDGNVLHPTFWKAA